MRMNQNRKPIHTHEGAVAKHINPEQALRRSLLSCMLWEREFYEDGESIADRILTLADECSVKFVSDLAIKARLDYKLRHAPLWLCLSLIKRGGPIVSKTLEQVINRPDELAELVAMYWKGGKRPLSKQMKLGLGAAFNKFDEYQFAKWDRPGEIKLRDVLFLSHPKPKDDAQQDLFDKIANKTLALPDTWESKMAGGGDKKEVFTDLLTRKKLGYMALLRNLRGMDEVGVDSQLIKIAIMKPSATPLPYRFIAAAKAAPRYERELDIAMKGILENKERLTGSTILLVDVSGSMDHSMSGKSDLMRSDAAAGLAILLAGICDQLRVFTFSNNTVEIAPREGMALADAIKNSQSHGATYLGKAVNAIDHNFTYDRLIVITDEQSHDPVPDPKGRGYMLNVASNQNGVGYHAWTHIDGFSEACVDFIQELEKGVDS